MALLYPEATISWDAPACPFLMAEDLVGIGFDISPAPHFLFDPFEVSVAPVDPNALFNEDTGTILFNEDTGEILTGELAL